VGKDPAGAAAENPDIADAVEKKAPLKSLEF
jgi:hypothetical protein